MAQHCQMMLTEFGLATLANKFDDGDDGDDDYEPAIDFNVLCWIVCFILYRCTNKKTTKKNGKS